MNPWPMIKADREALGEYLASLSSSDWDQQSLCTDWTVKGVAAHLLVVPTMSKANVFVAFASSGFNLDKMSGKLVERLSATMSGDDIAAATRASAGSRSVPPGLKPMSTFCEVLVHSADISEAVGKPLDFPLDHYQTGLEFMKDVEPVLGCRTRVAGLRLNATDVDWSSGDGPDVEGPAKYLLLAMTGRRSPLEHLSGDGVDIIRGR